MFQYDFIAGIVFRYFMDTEGWYFCGRYSVGAMFRDHSLRSGNVPGTFRSRVAGVRTK